MTFQENHKCIFVGGVHGVGKSSLCANYADATGVGHYVASELIKRFKDMDEGLYKEVKDVGRNQDTLISGMHAFITHSSYLLDGHFVIRSQRDGLVRIPLETFRAIAPVGIVVVVGDTRTAFERMNTRDGKSISQDVLNEMQIAEIEHAELVANQLGIPIKIFDGVSCGNFTELIQSLAE